MIPTPDNLRAKFEAFARANHITNFLRRDDYPDEYCTSIVQFAWEAYQAATAEAARGQAECVEALEAIESIHGNLPLDGLEESCGPNEGAMRGIKLRACLETARRVLTSLKGGQ